jgi:pyridoxal 5'-phosphate synthase pdxT subunit
MAATIGVLALQGGFSEHLNMLRHATKHLPAAAPQLQSTPPQAQEVPEFIEVRNVAELDRCDALLIPGGESTTISIVAQATGLLEPLREFVKSVNPKTGLMGCAVADNGSTRVKRKPVWGTCAGLILLSEAAENTQKGGQELIGGLDVRVKRNAFGRQINSFTTELTLPFLNELEEDPAEMSSIPFKAVFIRAPVVESILPRQEGTDKVEVLASVKHGAVDGENRVVAVRQGHIFGTSFHPELTDDFRIHLWWLNQVLHDR